MKKLIEYKLTLFLIFLSVYIDILLFLYFHNPTLIYLITLVEFIIVTRSFFRIIIFEDDYLIFIRLFSRKKFIRYSIIENILFHNKIVKGGRAMNVILYLKNEEYTLSYSLSNKRKKELIEFFKSKNIKILFKED
jgi:hypothetical protein